MKNVFGGAGYGDTPSYEFQPMADVEKEFLSLFEELKEKIRKRNPRNE